MAEDKEAFLSRWSRRKLGALSGETAPVATPATPPAATPSTPAPPLPSPEELGFDSDFTAFMRGKVDEGVRREALKKLFADPRFNVMDGLDTYIDDYSIEDPIPEEMLARLEHSRHTLMSSEEREQARLAAMEKEAAAQQAAQEAVPEAPTLAEASTPASPQDPEQELNPKEKHGAPGQDPQAV